MENTSNSRGMVTLKCWGSEINSFLLSSSKPTPVGPARTHWGEKKRFQKMMEGIYGSSSGVNPAFASTQLGRDKARKCSSVLWRLSFRKLESYIRKNYFLLSFTGNPGRFYKTTVGCRFRLAPFFFFFK